VFQQFARKHRRYDCRMIQIKNKNVEKKGKLGILLCILLSGQGPIHLTTSVSTFFNMMDIELKRIQKVFLLSAV
jgi:hypothetical protein